jgi:hypothetical protein
MAYEVVVMIELEVGSHGAMAVKRSVTKVDRNIEYYEKLETLIEGLKEEVNTK